MGLRHGLLALAVVIGISSFAWAQVTVLPGSVMRGEELLQKEGCFSCHSLNGHGGTRAPDFARLPELAKTPALFATEMWNHAPRMWAQFQAEKRDIPFFDSAQVADLFAYFYSTLYFSPAGSAERGRSLFQQKRCAGCHSEVLGGKDSRNPFTDWMDLQDPSAWAERMWDHADKMASAMANRGVPWPHLTDQDVVDLLVYLSRSPDAQAMPAFSVGEPEMPSPG